MGSCHSFKVLERLSGASLAVAERRLNLGADNSFSECR